jgi:8-oxo-dGTP diphosphatase
MRTRAAAILIEHEKLALIERHRAGRHYFAFPGGGVDEGETVQQAVVRELLEETGLRVTIERQVIELWYQGGRQVFFLVCAVEGVFGTGTGEEYIDPQPDDPNTGTYVPVWMPVSEILDQPVLPREAAELVARSLKEGWPEEPVVIHEEPG